MERYEVRNESAEQRKAMYFTLSDIAEFYGAESGEEPLPGDLLVIRGEAGWHILKEPTDARLSDSYTFLIRSTYNRLICTFLNSFKETVTVNGPEDLALEVPLTDITLAQLSRLRLPRFIAEMNELLPERPPEEWTKNEIDSVKSKLLQFGQPVVVESTAGMCSMDPIVAVGTKIRDVLGGLVPRWGMKVLEKERKQADEEKRRSEEQIAELKRLIEKHEEAEQRFHETMLGWMSDMKAQLERVERKLDLVAEAVQSLQLEMDAIRSTSRDVEEKILLLHHLFDEKLGSLSAELKNDLRKYVQLLQGTMTHWSKLDSMSQEMLPLAEYLFDRLQQIPDVDFSPVILNYCRSLENEMLKKIFVEFSLHLYRKYPDLDDFLAADFKLKDTSKFAKQCKHYRHRSSEEMKYTLGDMNHMLKCALSPIHKDSPLLTELVAFVQNKTEPPFVLTSEFTRNMKSILDNYRNKCAHPYKLDLSVAAACKRQVPVEIDHLVGALVP